MGFQDAWWKFKRNKQLQLMLVVVVLVVVAALLGWLVYSQSRNSEGSDESTNTNQATGMTARKIDGVQVDAEFANLPVKAIIVENLSSIRPQSGLGQAQVVYETLAEGGITRFMAIFATDETVDPIGPVRSARHYFVDWAEEYGGLFMHVGGSPQALGILHTSDYMTDVNQFSNGQFYYRDGDIAAPHNVFTSTQLYDLAVRDVLSASGETPSYRGYQFGDEAEVSNQYALADTANTVVLDFSSFAYQVEWRYDATQNVYTRYNGGDLQVDANTDEPLTAKTIVVQRVESELLEADTGRIDVTTIGSGDAIIFSNGKAIEGTWKKLERGDRTLFFTEEGEEVVFAAGQIWIEAIPVERAVEY